MSSTVGRISQLDESTLLKLQAGCNFINAEVDRVRHRLYTIGAICAIVALTWYLIASKNGQNDPRLPIAVPLVILSFFVARERRALAKTYKGIVVHRVVKALGDGLTYTPESSLTKDEFLSMDLFEKRAEKWHAEDEVCGKKNTVSYSVHEAKATREEGSGRSRHTVIIFKGLVIRLDFNKNFHGHTVVVPDREGQILGGLFGESESRRSKKIVRLENPDFESVFSVYSTNDQEARYLITPKMMELMMKAQLTVGAELRMCFVENSLFVTLPQSVDRFEISLFGGKITPMSAVGDLAAIVQLASQMVDALDLETRIWTRV